MCAPQPPLLQVPVILAVGSAGGFLRHTNLAQTDVSRCLFTSYVSAPLPLKNICSFVLLVFPVRSTSPNKRHQLQIKLIDSTFERGVFMVVVRPFCIVHVIVDRVPIIYECDRGM